MGLTLASTRHSRGGLWSSNRGLSLTALPLTTPTPLNIFQTVAFAKFRLATHHKSKNGQGSAAPIELRREEKAQAQAIDPIAQLFLHGRQVPWLLYHHDRVFARSDPGSVRRLRNSSVEAHWWKVQAHRRLLLPKEGGQLKWGASFKKVFYSVRFR